MARTPQLIYALVIAFAFSTNGAWSEDGFRLGIVNERPERPDFVLSQFGELRAYVQDRLATRGFDTDRIAIARSIDEMVNWFEHGKVDAVLDSVMPTLLIERRTERLEPTLLVWRKGQREYHSVFFVHRASTIQSLQDLSGKLIAFEAPRSTSAYYVPKAALKDAGLTLASAETSDPGPDVLRYVFAGSELNQAYWVHQGRADVGAFNNGDWERVTENVRADLRIIHRTRPLPRWLCSVRRDIDPALRAALVDVLTTAHRDAKGRSALETAANIVKFELLTDADRDSLLYWSDVLD